MLLQDICVGETVAVKLRAGRFMIKATMTRGNKKDNRANNRIFIAFPFNRTLLDEIKSFEGRKWHGNEDPPRKVWSFPISQRNQFKLDYLTGANPYGPYDVELTPIEPHRDCLREHQKLMLSFVITRRHSILAGEMGTGKTLVAIEALEWFKDRYGLQNHEAWYVGPRSGVMAVSRELVKWKATVQPRMFTYEKMSKEICDWTPGRPAPKVVIFDESSKLKNPSAQRTQSARHLANCMREEHGRDCLIIEMTGTPAPKSPVDWWSQAEVACPGFLKEGNIHTFKAGLCLIQEREGLTGVYPHLVTWWDDSSKCSTCGKLEDDPIHDFNSELYDHVFTSSTNEVERLYRRLSGLSLIVWKKDCTDLPDKQYEIIRIKPTPAMLRAAKLITKKSDRAITCLTLLRELSDGFQYEAQELDELTVCPDCDGTGTISEPVYDHARYDMQDAQGVPANVEYADAPCPRCAGNGNVARVVRTTNSTSSPKDRVLADLLEEYSDVGRFVVWGGFTGTLDRLVQLCHSNGWATLRVDGGGYVARDADGNPCDADIFLSAMDRSNPDYDKLAELYPRICFVGHPQAGGMALTLTASPIAVYYSNSFNGEARIQSEDRIHRLGMDTNKGARIVDLVLLASDELVLNNLLKKKKLQTMTMGDLTAQWEAIEREV